MDGVHDMGGMHGFGPVDTTDDDSLHHDWEWVIFAIDRILKSEGHYNIDEKRHAIERLPPATYLGSSYFERWMEAIETFVVDHQFITEEELDRRHQEIKNGTDYQRGTDTDTDGIAARISETLYSVGSFRRDPQHPVFEEGQTVQVHNNHPEGHTRCPRYARRATGIITGHHGTFVFPDQNAHGEEAAEPLYTVEFTATELWGDDYPDTDTVCIDLWESYLQPIYPADDNASRDQ